MGGSTRQAPGIWQTPGVEVLVGVYGVPWGVGVRVIAPASIMCMTNASLPPWLVF